MAPTVKTSSLSLSLSSTYPFPSLYLDSPILPKLKALVPKIMLSMAPTVMPRIVHHILNGRSVKYFHETRTKRFGMPLDELEKSKKVARGCGRVRLGLEEVANLFKENGGPFFVGQDGKCTHLILAMAILCEAMNGLLAGDVVYVLVPLLTFLGTGISS